MQHFIFIDSATNFVYVFNYEALRPDIQQMRLKLLPFDDCLLIVNEKLFTRANPLRTVKSVSNMRLQLLNSSRALFLGKLQAWPCR